MLHETLRDAACPFELIGVEVVETNPILDRSNETAKMAVEWVCSLFGKRIMPPWQ
jgi:arginase